MKNTLFILLLNISLLAFCQEEDFSDYEFKAPTGSKASRSKSGPKPVAFKLSFGTGLSNYYGDLNASLGSFTPGMAYSIGSRFFVKKKITFQPQLSFFKLQGDDSKTGNEIRNLSFQSNNIECSFNFYYDFVEYEPRWDLRKRFSPFISGGLGLLFFKPKAEYNGTLVDLHQLQTEGIDYNTTTLTAGVGFGFRIAVTERSNINFECRYTLTMTNYLDDVHGTYQDINNLSGTAEVLADRTFEGGFTPTDSFDGEHWKEGTQRGSSSLTDRYITLMIHYEVDMFRHSIVYPAF